MGNKRRRRRQDGAIIVGIRSSTASSLTATTRTTTLDIPSTSSQVDFKNQATIEGDETQIVTITVKPGQTVRSQGHGSMVFMSGDMEMKTWVPKGAMQRIFTGNPLFISDYSCPLPSQHNSQAKKCILAMSGKLPSKILRLNLDAHGGKLICRKGAFFATNADVDIGLQTVASIRTGLFGQQGFFIQTLEGRGSVLLSYGGALIKKKLKRGETLRVGEKSLVAYTPDVAYNVERTKGWGNILFGGEALFRSTLTGPGIVWLQGFPPENFRKEVHHHHHHHDKNSSSSRR